MKMNKNKQNSISIEENKVQISDTFKLGAILAIAGGYLDAYTYVARDKVFANAQTGNIVLLGTKLTEGKILEAFHYLVPMFAFVVGVFVAEGVRNQFHMIRRVHWRQMVLVIELVVLIFTAFIPQGAFDMIVNTFISFVCALQVQSFRKINGNTYATTMCTGNLRSGTECLYQYLMKNDEASKDKAIQYYGIIAFFIIGAALGAFVTGILHEKSVLICCLFIVIAVLMMNQADDYNRQ